MGKKNAAPARNQAGLIRWTQFKQLPLTVESIARFYSVLDPAPPLPVHFQKCVGDRCGNQPGQAEGHFAKNDGD